MEKHRIGMRSVGVFLKSGQTHSDSAVRAFHNGLDKFGGSVSYADISAVQTEKPFCQHGIDLHPGRILSEKSAEICSHLILHPLRREIWIHQIAEVQHVRKSPIASVPAIVLGQSGPVFREQGFRNVQVLYVVYLVPLLSVEHQSLELRIVQQGYDLQHLLVIFVIAQRLAVGLQERHIFATGK